MKITVVGCGTAFSNNLGNSCFLLEEGNRKMMIDFGTKVPFQMNKLNINFGDITDVYISHLHADHVGGLEEMAFKRYDWFNMPHRWDDYILKRNYTKVVCVDDKEEKRLFNYKQYAPRLIGDSRLLNELWNHTLKGGLRTLQNIDTTLETFFEPIYLEPNEDFSWCGWKIELVQMVHFMGYRTINPSHGLIMSKPGSYKIFFTTDSQYCTPEQIKDFYNSVDIIFQDCELMGIDVPKKNMMFNSGVHANYAQLAGWESANNHKLPKSIKNKMWLTHYDDFKELDKDFFGNSCNWDKQAREDGFLGFLKPGQKFDIPSGIVV